MAVMKWRGIVGAVCLGVAMIVSDGAAGQSLPNSLAVPVIDGPRIAVLIGNTYYGNLGKIKSIEYDIIDMNKLLTNLGFKVYGGDDYINLKRADIFTIIKQKIPKYMEEAKGGIFLFYYSGHGMSLDGKGRIMPVDANVSDLGNAYATTIGVDEFLEAIAKGANPNDGVSKGFLSLVIFDACRNDPYAMGLAQQIMSPIIVGISSVSAPAGMIVAASTQPGGLASPGDGARNSRYTGQLLRFLGQPGVSLNDTLALTAKAVKEISSGDVLKQTPWTQAGDTSLGLVALRAAPQPEPSRVDDAILACNRLHGGSDPAVFEDYIKKFPQGACVGYAKVQLAQLRSPPALPPVSPPVSPPTAAAVPLSNPSPGAAAALARVGELPPVLLQYALTALGHYSGAASGKWGSVSRRGVEAFQKSQEQSATGNLTPEQTVLLVRAAAGTGQAQSQNTMGMMFATGVGVEKDSAEAVKWFQRAAAQGDAQGKHNLALMLLDGVGAPKDATRARSLLNEAAAAGYEKSRTLLAGMR